MKKFFRLLAGALIGAVVLTNLTGCGGKKKKKTNPVAPETAVTSDSGKEFSNWEDNAEIRAAIENGQFAEARSRIMNRISENPQDARAHYLLGKCFIEEKKLIEAKKSLQAAIELEPENKNYTRELGRCHSVIADELIEKQLPSEAIENLLKAKEYNYQPNQTEERLSHAYNLTADSLINSGNTSEAESLLRDALNLIPDQPSLRVKLAQILIDGDRLMEAERILKSLSTTNPEYEPGLIAYAQLLFRMGEVNSAAAMIGKALAIAPADPDALALKSLIEKNVPIITPPVTEQLTPDAARTKLVELEKAGQLTEQKTVLENLVKQFPAENWAHLKLSEVNETLELFPEALESIKTYLQANPQSHQGNFVMARILRKNGQFEDALNLLNSIAETYENKEELHNELGQIYARMGRFDEAKSAWNKTLQLDPEHAKTLFNLGQLEMESGNTTQAQELFEKAIKVDPFNAKFRYFAGLNLIQSGLKDQAHSFWAASRDFLNDEDPYALRIVRALGDTATQPQTQPGTTEMNQPLVHVPASVIDEAPEDPDYAKALEYARAGYFNEAIQGFRQVLSRNPSDFNALMNLGKVYSISGDDARSCALYLKALKIDPKNIFALKALANSYSEIGLHRFAAEITSQARTSHPGNLDGFPNYKASPAAIKNSPRAYQPLIRAFLDEKLNQEAVAVIQSGIAEQQESAELLLLQGEVYKELGQFETALDAYKKALQLEPQNPQPYVKTGDLLIAAGQYSNAINEYQKALKAGFIDPDTMFVIVDRFKQLGREADARRVLGRLKGMNLNQNQIAKLEAHLGTQIEIINEE